MKAVDWAIQRIGADQSCCSLAGDEGPYPAVEPFEWWNSMDHSTGNRPHIRYYIPGLHGEALSHQHLTPQQMAFCLEHEQELEEWAELMKARAKTAYDAKRAREEAERRRQDERERLRKAEYMQELSTLIDA